MPSHQFKPFKDLYGLEIIEYIGNSVGKIDGRSHVERTELNRHNNICQLVTTISLAGR
jgi:hypothetical protein